MQLANPKLFLTRSQGFEIQLLQTSFLSFPLSASASILSSTCMSAWNMETKQLLDKGYHKTTEENRRNTSSRTTSSVKDDTWMYTACIFKIHFNILSPSTSIFPRCFLIRIAGIIFWPLSHLLHTCYISSRTQNLFSLQRYILTWT